METHMISDPFLSTERRTKVGLAAMCAAWFKQIGLQEPDSDLAKVLQQDYGRMVECLGGCFDEVIAPGILSSQDDAARATDRFSQEQVDAVVLVHIVWSEDPVLLSFLDRWRSTPVWLWNYHPTGTLPPRLTVDDLFRFSGTVGMLQGSAPLQKRGLRLEVFSGSPGDASLVRDLRERNAALCIRKAFRGLRAGQIAGRCEAISGTFVDDAALSRALGVTRVAVTAAEYSSTCEAVDPGRVDRYCAELRERFEVRGVSEPSLRIAARNTLALDDLVEQLQLGAVAIQDLDEELHRRIGTRPCLYPPRSLARGVAFSAEADLNTALGMVAASRAAKAPAMYTEIFTFDSHENVLLMGHAGVHDPRLAADGITIVPDLEYRQADAIEGAWMEFILAPGAVTCVSLYDTGAGYRMMVFEGQSLGPPRRLDGWGHAVIRPRLDVVSLLARLAQRGMTQHFAIVPGSVTHVLRSWCGLMGVEFCCEE
jgi:L-fucose isomerase-like protein